MSEPPLRYPESAAEASGPPTPMSGAELLSVEEADQLLARSRGRVAVWMGDSGSGKTALTTRLYERQRLVRESVRFAGSSTLLAFEALADQGRSVAAPAHAETQT